MPLPLPDALAEIRSALLDQTALRRAIAAGRRRGSTPSVVRAQLRPVRLKRGEHLQVVTFDGVRPATRNVPWGPAAQDVVDELLAEPFGNWHVETATETLQLRVTKRGEAALHRSATAHPEAPALAHDRAPEHLVDPADPLFDVIGGSATKRRQVDAFVRALASTVDAGGPGRALLRQAGPEHVGSGRAVGFESTVDGQALRVVDFGCGNAYLTFAAYRYLTESAGADVELVGVDVREDQRERNTELAATLGWAKRVRFVAGTIASADVPPADMVLALHACDTATDEALARAVRWRSRYVLVAPCCHHDIAAQLRARPAPEPYPLLTAAPILRERYADVLTDALRAALLRQHGYQVDVVEFIESRHTPRNLLLRARYTGTPATAQSRDRYAELTAAWGVTPALERLLAVPAAAEPGVPPAAAEPGCAAGSG